MLFLYGIKVCEELWMLGTYYGFVTTASAGPAFSAQDEENSASV